LIASFRWVYRSLLLIFGKGWGCLLLEFVMSFVAPSGFPLKLSVVDRALYRLGLGLNSGCELAFDIESKRFGARAEAQEIGKPVFVIGLARAGTSILTRMLHSTGEFASLTYRDMPFPLAPNLWAQLSKNVQRSVVLTERGHGDGLLHDLDSPEAIEELFWRVFEGKNYIEANCLKVSYPKPKTLRAFEKFIKLVALRCGKQRYLSKNNNNVLRIAALKKTFPEAVFLHPFRAPFQQASSSRAQHLRAEKLHAADPFRARYMRWLGHHEFGSDHRPFNFDASLTPSATGSPNAIEFWLKQWISAYQYLETLTCEQGHYFVNFDRLCAGDETVLRDCAAALDLSEDAFDTRHLKCPEPYPCTPVNSELLECAVTLHERLARQSCLTTPV
jgi:Sulfotransferase family